MAKLIATRSAQDVMSAEFIFNFDDTAVDTVAGTSKTFGAVFGDAIVFEAIPLPVNAVVVGGELIVETAGVGPTAYTIAVGDSTSATKYLAATSVLATGRTALTGLGLAIAGDNMRLTVASTVANATAGKFRLRMEYVTSGRAMENLIA